MGIGDEPLAEDPYVHRNPDVVLLREVDVEGYVAWRREEMAAYLPQYLQLRAWAFAEELKLLLAEKQPGDTLWLCRSRVQGVLIGSEGVCLVRDGAPILYRRVIQR